MILLGSLLALVVAAVLVRAAGGTRAPSGGERLYVALSPVPLLLSVVAPAAVGLTVGFVGRQTFWMHHAGLAGIAASALLGIVGLGLVVRAIWRGERWGWPLGASVVLAAMPCTVLLVGIALWSRG